MAEKHKTDQDEKKGSSKIEKQLSLSVLLKELIPGLQSFSTNAYMNSAATAFGHLQSE